MVPALRSVDRECPQPAEHHQNGANTRRSVHSRLAEAAEKSWRRLNGHNLLPKLIMGGKFADGIEITSQAQAAAA